MTRPALLILTGPPAAGKSRLIGSRHPGHHDRERVEELPEQLERGVYEPPELGIPVLRVDTSENRYRPDVDEIAGWCRQRLSHI